ncbi:MAG: AraC family transcriptional regulator [Oscillospiraceae bacterium]|nr:AraC family transcriptional regulator [Oscillospiraceae bacterium]
MIEFYETSYDLTAKQNSDLEGILFGLEDCAPSHAYGPTLRPYHLFHFVTRGRGILRIAGSEYALGPGDAFLIPAEQMAYYEASAEEPWSYAWAGITGLRAAWYVQQLLELSPERWVLRGLDTEKYAASIRRAAYLEGSGAVSYFQVGVTLYELFSYLASDLSGLGRAGYSPNQAKRIKFYLDAKYTEKLRLEDVADHFHLHPNHLSRVFREEFGVAPKQYLMGLKLEKSAKMLAETDAPVALVAASLGFDDQHSFSRAFKNYWGVSPLSYRKVQN